MELATALKTSLVGKAKNAFERLDSVSLPKIGDRCELRVLRLKRGGAMSTDGAIPQWIPATITEIMEVMHGHLGNRQVVRLKVAPRLMSGRIGAERQAWWFSDTEKPAGIERGYIRL